MAAFLIQPFARQTSIRSALGFMSLATKWGGFLFPGITVLTRDLHDVLAMHGVAAELGDSGREHVLLRLRKRTVDPLIGRRLVRIVMRKGWKKPERPTQQMTYWQRYGSLFTYFKLLSKKRLLSIAGYRKMIFEKKGARHEEKKAQLRRIRHFKWYRRWKRKLLVQLNLDSLRKDFRGRRWWLTGRGAPAGVPPAIVAVRQLEYFFLIWQTAFEAAAWLLHQGGRVNVQPARGNPSDLDFVDAFLGARSQPSRQTMRRLLRVCLRLHDSRVRPRAAKWEKEIVELDDMGKSSEFTQLHNGKTICELAKVKGAALLGPLANLHVTYANLQNKSHAITVHSFEPPKGGSRYPQLTAEFSEYRWGLHGYRLQAALTLNASEKYDKK